MILRWVCLLLILASGLTAIPTNGAEKLIVGAAASLKGALEEVEAAYSEQRRDLKLVFNFAGSGMLQQQIENGAPVDVFISAAPRHMDVLEKKGLILADTRRDLLTNTLVLIASENAPVLTSFNDLQKPQVRRIAVGDPRSVPVGAYAADVIRSLGLAESLAPKLVRTLDARQVLTSVETGNAEAGVVYLTDAKFSGKVRVAATAPEGSHARIVYPVGVINTSRKPDQAREFATFLDSRIARAIFEKHGFHTL
ncbi:MAG TPA: molybdate ABC transporter substrate-binding protein [Chthoniobacteraceae bacterium]|jgi:molybdate transport system substrate-binding protein